MDARTPEDPDRSPAAFGRFLIEEGIIDTAVQDRAARAARSTGERFDKVLVTLGLMAEGEVTGALGRFVDMPLAAPEDRPPVLVLPEMIDAAFVRRNRVMPLGLDDERLTVGLTDPFDDEPLRALAYLAGRQVAPRLLAPGDFDRLFHDLYVGEAHGGEPQGGLDASETDIRRLREAASEAPTIRLVGDLIAAAVEARASDIHIEPAVDAVQVRYRIDGALRTARTLPAHQRAAVTSRVKIMAGLDIAERRLPQDGRIRLAVRGVDIDFRVSTIPTAFGESVVLRILDRARVVLDFRALGLPDELIAAFTTLTAEPNGIILVTGPTGSGKTTTLYTALQGLGSPERKLFTVEDPIEYQLAGINQVQVHPAIGLDFPHALRSILRQDPDIVMIGEIRDLETARIAIQASLTGHLVFSTLHTNSAAATMTRLVDMGVEPYLLASTVKGVLAQRLVRRLCAHCARPHDDAALWAGQLRARAKGLEALGAPNISQAVGCAVCGETGYAGRTAIAELLLVDAAIHRLLLTGAADAEIDDAARAAGMVGLYEAGLRKVWQGVTTLDEVLRATRVV